MSHSEPTWILDLWVSVWHILLPEVILRTVGGCFLLHIMGQVKEKMYSLCVYMGEPVHESVQLSLCASAACALSASLSVTFWEGHIPDVLRVTVSQRERGSQVEGGPWLVAQHQELYQSKELEPKSIHQHSCCFCCHGKYTKGLCHHTFKIIFLWNWFFKDTHFSSCYVYLCEQKCIVVQIKTVHV